MTKNRSVPPDTLIPHVCYGDVPEAIEWLCRTFGFREHFRYGNPVSGAQVYFGEAWIMLKQVSEGQALPRELGYGTQHLTIFVRDVESHYIQTKAAGAKIVEVLHETIYGERQYGVEDLAGHLWLFSQHARDRDPRDWGATMKEVKISQDEL